MARNGLTTEDDIKNMQLELQNAESGIVDVKVKKLNRKKIIDFVVMGVLILLTLFFVIRAVTSKASGEPTDIFGLYFFSVETESMVPTLYVNDIFVSKKVTSSTTINVGDIITFTNSKNQRVTHRVVDIVIENNVTKYQTKGDSKYNDVDPDLITRSDIVGVFWFKLPSLKTNRES